MKTKIEWTDRSDWNCVRGCTRVSPGCGGPGPHGGCYAEAIAGRFSGGGQPFYDFATMTPASGGALWTGKVELVEERLTLPRKWQKPARIFVNSMYDLFHEKLPDDAIDRIFAVMAQCPQHTFQVLTKRPARMLAYFSAHWSKLYDGLPFKNVWLGTSVENQETADERIPLLLRTPAAVRFVSAEPLLAPIDFMAIRAPRETDDGIGWTFDALAKGDYYSFKDDRHYGPYRDHAIDWVIAGGESGPRARPMQPDWARSLRDQCAAANVPFFFKQWGEWAPYKYAPPGRKFVNCLTERRLEKNQAFETEQLFQVGRRAAGRLLDGVQHDGMPRCA